MQTSALHPSFSAPLCVDCANYRQEEFHSEPFCGRLEVAIRDVVTGEIRYDYCGEQRSCGQCGPDGRHFTVGQATTLVVSPAQEQAITAPQNRDPASLVTR